jgi:translation initiation factor IF-2
MPQTKEAIAHAKAARVPIIVAMNKIDKPNSNPERVKQQLAELELVPDDWGGNTMVVPVSAKLKQGIDDLLEGILLVADNTDIRANPAGKVMGTVIEAEVDKSKGTIATLLVQNGTLSAGDIVVAGKSFASVQAGEARALSLIVKADVQGSLEPILGELEKLGKGEIAINILYAETGNIGENDVMLASASKAIIVGFNVQADVSARRLAEAEGISIRLYDIIYRMTEDIEKALKGMLEPTVVEKVIGRAQVLAVFSASKLGRVAGCRVVDGELRSNSKVRLYRGTDLVYEGEMASLRHEKEDVREIRTGYECGVGLKNFNDIQVNDLLICYILETNE